jgi:deazaflavin-dependent oxidoreductase (nitroreductase family)
VTPEAATGFESERKHNPFVSSGDGALALNLLHRPWFAVRLPLGYGTLATRGRKSGKTRRRNMRAIRDGDKVYVVAIKGDSITGWAKNARAEPRVRLRIRDGTFDGVARDLRPDEIERAREVYCDGPVGPFEYVEYRMWKKGRPTPERIRALHRAWFEQGTPMVIDLSA